MFCRQLALVSLFVCAHLLASCGNDGPEGDDIWTAPVDVKSSLLDMTMDVRVATEDVDVWIPLDTDMDNRAVELPDSRDAELPPEHPTCEAGDVKCKYNNKAELWCVEGPNGLWHWDEPKQCADSLECKEGAGCTCEFGSCDGTEALSECGGKTLGSCETWTCSDNCCQVELLPPPSCCNTGSDCQDCLYPDDNDERFPCPGEIPEGAQPDLCTQDICGFNECSYADKICDDGDILTLDSCDPETGSCLNMPDPYQAPNYYCWGATMEEAQGKCFDNDLCTLEHCDFGDEFEPYVGNDLPDFDPFCSEDHPDWPNCVPKPSNIYLCKSEDKVTAGACDDFDPCTIDSCDSATGCTHGFDFDSAACWCDEDADCEDENACTVEYCNLVWDVCVYPQLDCFDTNPCTDDTCSPDEGCTIEPDPWCDGSCEGSSICLTDDPDQCDDANACTIDFCEFEPNIEFGCCKSIEMVCDDGVPETEEICVDGACVEV